MITSVLSFTLRESKIVLKAKNNNEYQINAIKPTRGLISNATFTRHNLSMPVRYSCFGSVKNFDV